MGVLPWTCRRLKSKTAFYEPPHFQSIFRISLIYQPIHVTMPPTKHLMPNWTMMSSPLLSDDPIQAEIEYTWLQHEWDRVKATTSGYNAAEAGWLGEAQAITGGRDALAHNVRQVACDMKDKSQEDAESTSYKPMRSNADKVAKHTANQGRHSRTMAQLVKRHFNSGVKVLTPHGDMQRIIDRVKTGTDEEVFNLVVYPNLLRK